MAKATKILDEKTVMADGHIVSIKVWGLASPVEPCTHSFKYSLFFGIPGDRMIAYDNERGKGDHKHILGDEVPYRFVSLRRLLSDFRDDIRTHCNVEIG